MSTLEQVELAEKVLDFIKAHPENHNQQSYLSAASYDTLEKLVARPLTTEAALKCGARACFCGWLAVLDGQRVTAGLYVLLGEDLQQIHEWGIERLGLDDWDGDPDAHHLFADNNDLDDLERHVADMRSDYEAGQPTK